MKALIGLRLDPSGAGVPAITTMSSARGPLVVQSFSPLRIQCKPSSESSAVVDMFAGSEPTSCSVSANAESAPFASLGRYLSFCSAVPNFMSGPGTPMLWCAERNAPVAPHREPTIASARLYECCDNPRPPYLTGILIPKAPNAARPVSTSSGTHPSLSI